MDSRTFETVEIKVEVELCLALEEPELWNVPSEAVEPESRQQQRGEDGSPASNCRYELIHVYILYV
jgi:hypothetical protein